MELSGTSWVVGTCGPQDPEKISLHKLPASDAGGLMERIEGACAACGGKVRVLLTYEAGYEGFWLARWLGRRERRIEVAVCDPASLEVVRRSKVAKTDRIDARRMIRALRAWDRGEAEALSRVRIPTEAEEDARHLLRGRDSLVRDRVRLNNRIKGLLKLHGIGHLNPRSAKFGDELGEAETALGAPLPPGIRRRIEREWECLRLVERHLAEIEREKAELVKKSAASREPEPADAAEAPAGAKDVRPAVAADLTRLKGVGSNDAIMLETEVLWRGFRNRREIAAWAGLAPMPWASGPVDRQQGISKAGNAKVRKDLIQLAWRWVRWQPESDIAVWFQEYCAARDGRSRKRGIVAVARKLLVALWRYAATGLVPAGAVLSPAA